MRTVLHSLLGVLLAIGVSGAAQAATFDLQFAAPGADCATDQAVDCNSADIIEEDGDLHFDIGGGVELIVNAYDAIVFDLGGEAFEGALGVAIQDYPQMGGLAVLSDTDQVEAGEALFFSLSSGETFNAGGITFFDNHGLPNPETMVQVYGLFEDGGWDTATFSIGDLEGGALTGIQALAWVFQGVEGEETWYIGSMSSVPEPGTAMLLGLGLMTLASRRKLQA